METNLKARRIVRLEYKGAGAGFMATVPMTLFMLLMQRLLPRWQRYALPPEEITNELAERMNVKQYLDKRRQLIAALVAHFGYGAGMGVLYPMFMKKIALPAVSKGIVFGLVVWTFSYLGLLPALGMSESAFKEPIRRNILMIGAHIVWGISLGIGEKVMGD